MTTAISRPPGRTYRTAWDAGKAVARGRWATIRNHERYVQRLIRGGRIVGLLDTPENFPRRKGHLGPGYMRWIVVSHR